MPENAVTNAQALTVAIALELTLSTTDAENGRWRDGSFLLLSDLSGIKREIIPSRSDETVSETSRILPDFLEFSITEPTAFTEKPMPVFMQKSSILFAFDSLMLPDFTRDSIAFAPARQPPS